MEAAARDPERVVIRFPKSITEGRPAEVVYLDDEDEGFLREMMEKSLSEFFVDHVIWPLIGVTIVSLLILVITGSLWMSAKMVFDMKEMLT